MSSTLGASLLRTVLSDGTLKILGSGLDKGPIITINARQNAEILCDGAGSKLGQLLRIDYNWSEINIYSRTQYVAEDMVMYNSLSSIDIEPDDVECEDTATFVWTIE